MSHNKTLFTLFVATIFLGYALIWATHDERIVHPHDIGSGTAPGRPGIAEFSLHEYIGKNHLTSGRSLVFRMPRAYLVSVNNMGGGPQREIRVQFSSRTGEPFKGLRDPELQYSISASLMYIEPEFGRYTPRYYPLDQVLAGKVIGSTLITGPETLRHVGQFAGFDMFDRERNGEKYIGQPEPFDRASYFARRNAGGLYDTFVSCTLNNIKREKPGAVCNIHTSFLERWPMHIVFRGDQLIRFDALLEQVREVFKRHLIKVTDPRPK